MPASDAGSDLSPSVPQHSDDIVAESRCRIAGEKVDAVDDARRSSRPVVAFSSGFEARVRELEAFLQDRVYRHHRLVRMDDRARRFIEQLFNAFLGQPQSLPDRFAGRIDEQGTHRVICDYIAGMTDRFCQDEYKRIFEPSERIG